ncbi:MAG: hypothetical protein ACREV7_22470 [Steroidobacteraceae bacterium]
MQNRAPGRLGKIRWNEVFSRVEVVLSGLVDDSDLAQAFRACIWNRNVNLAALQRYFVAGIIQANHQSFHCPWHRLLLEEPLDLELALADTGRLVPVYLGAHHFAAFQVDLSETFSFPPSPAPISLAKPRDLPDSGTGGDGLNIDELAQNPEMHDAWFQSRILASTAR